MKQRQEEQVDLFVAMMARLQQYARDKFDAPLVVVYSWPDETSRRAIGASEFDQPMLVDMLARDAPARHPDGGGQRADQGLSGRQAADRARRPSQRLHQRADRRRAQAAAAAAMTRRPAGRAGDRPAGARRRAGAASAAAAGTPRRALAASDQRRGVGAKRRRRLVADRPGLRARTAPVAVPADDTPERAVLLLGALRAGALVVEGPSPVAFAVLAQCSIDASVAERRLHIDASTPARMRGDALPAAGRFRHDRRGAGAVSQAWTAAREPAYSAATKKRRNAARSMGGMQR